MMRRTFGIEYFRKRFSLLKFLLLRLGFYLDVSSLLLFGRDNNIGKFYGEYSQGSNYSNSGMQAFVLPYSKTLVWIPVFQFKMRTPNFQYDTKGIKPDIEIQIQSNDLKTKFDRQLNYVIKQIETNK